MSNTKDFKEAQQIATDLFHDWAKLPVYEPLDEDLVLSLIERIRVAILTERKRNREALKEAQEMMHDLFVQACGEYNRETEKHTFDHMCLSAYEGAQDYLIQVGLIHPDQCTRR